MPSKNSDKNKDSLKELEKNISPILIVNNNSLKPYVELFEYSPENIYQQPLGSLVGFFEIKEYSQDSAYIVNFLTSVLKKEYYINPKRPVTESFDAALHKVNMALSELAKHGNVEWLGKLHSAICVIEKNSVHFSVSGGAKLFIYRNKALSDIGEGLASDSIDPHPLKTFVNVSSGRLESGDRLIITSEDIFHIFTFAELRKNLERLEGEKFIQFLKTALSNQLEMIATLVIDSADEKISSSKKISSDKKVSKKSVNVFSEKAFSGSNLNTAVQSEEFEENLKEEETSPEYTDKKTGHIYVQGETRPENETNQVQIYLEISKEKMADFWYFTKNTTRRRFVLYKKQLTKALKKQQLEWQQKKQARAEQKQLELEEKQKALEEFELEKIAENQRVLLQTKVESQNEPLSAKKEVAKLEPIIDLKKKNRVIQAAPEIENLDEEILPVEIEQEFNLAAKETEEESLPGKSGASVKLEKIIIALSELGRKILIFSQKYFKIFKEKSSPLFEKGNLLVKKVLQKEEQSKIIPHFSKIKRLFSAFSIEQRIYTLIALLLIFIVPIFIARWLNKPKQPTIATLQMKIPTITETLEMDKNIKLSTESKMILSRNDLVTPIISTDSIPVIATRGSVLVIQNQETKEYALPTNSGKVTAATYMKDLSLLLLMTDQNKIISFSPTTHKFTDNKIDLNSVSGSANFIGTYLTYLYVLDTKNSQIYRYPRAEGGFGGKTNWYKDTASFEQVSAMTIDDNIYAIQNNQVLKFFKGKQVDFKLETSNTPVHFDNIFTTPDLTSFYVLDTKKQRLVQYSKEGAIIAQYFNEALRDSISFAVDESNKLAYVATPTGLISLSLQ